MGYLLGIDVGTTRTAAAISRAGGRPGDVEVVTLGDRSSSVPSVLSLGPDGTVVVGEIAERRAVSDPDHVVREFKRRIGDPTPLLVGGRPWAPEELSALLVRWVADRVAQREGGGASRIAVTHPASWSSHKKDLLRAALAHHSLPVTFLPEPQAAAMHYAAAERVEPGSTIAVYDFGGGTFDAAVVHKEGQGFRMLGRPEGVERLGGIDLDELVFEHVREGLPDAFDGLDETDPGVLLAVAGVRRECTEAKEALSSDTEVSIPVFTPARQGTVRLHRSEFESMIRPQVEETVAALRRAVGSAGLTPDRLTAVLLVGGSSRIPLVAQLVSEQLGRPVAVDTDPKNAIAMGAALSLIPAAPAGTGPHVPAPRSGASARLPIGTGAVGAVGAGAHRSGGHRSVAAGAFGEPDQEDAPPTQRLATSGPRGPASAPPPRPVVPAAVEYDHAPDLSPAPRRGRSPAVLVGAGGAASAVAIIAAAFLLPHQAKVETIGVQTQPTSAPAAPVTTTEAPPTTTVAPTTVPPETRAPRTTRVVVPPPVTTTQPVPTTTVAPTPTSTTKTTPPATTTPTTSSTKAPAAPAAPGAAV